jgi:hypothetical protein
VSVMAFISRLPEFVYPALFSPSGARCPSRYLFLDFNQFVERTIAVVQRIDDVPIG